MYPVLFHWGAIAIYSYGFMIACGVCLSLFLIQRNFLRSPLDKNLIADCVLLLLFAGIVGARLWFVIVNIHDYWDKPLSVLKVWEGGLIVYGGLFFACVALAIVARVKRMPFWQLSDSLMPYLALSQAFGRIGCFMNGCCWGAPSQSFFAVRFPFLDHTVHPVQLYSSGVAFTLFLFLTRVYRRRRYDGEVTILYFVLYALLRTLLEFFRGDQPPIVGVFNRPQIISVAVAIFFLGVAMRMAKKGGCR